MKTLRALHLQLGCVFAPMLVFFAVSGVWQLLRQRWLHPQDTPYAISLLSTLHTGHRLKVEDGAVTLSSVWMQAFVVAMALALVATIVLGVVIAFRFGRRKSALCCLAAGVAVPLAFAIIAVHT